MYRCLLAEFDTPEALASALRALRDKGYRRLDAHTPYSTEIVRDALELPPSRLPWLVFCGGILGAGLAYLLEWYLNAHLYPYDAGGRPPHMPLAFVPISFEMGVLLASFTAFFLTLVGAKLLRLWHPLFEVEGFERSSIDRFFLRVSADDPKFDVTLTTDELEAFAPRRQILLTHQKS
jgi:hypothetical protein